MTQADIDMAKRWFGHENSHLAKLFEEHRLASTAPLVEVLEWYGEQARLCRLIHSESDAGRHALNDDGGKLARQVLTPFTKGQNDENA